MPSRKHLIGSHGLSPLCMISSNVANVAGSGAGASVTVDLSSSYQDQFSVGILPLNYSVLVTPSQAATANVINKSNSGFQVVLTPVLASATLTAGTFDCVVLGG
jgi:hypothetical protein